MHILPSLLSRAAHAVFGPRRAVRQVVATVSGGLDKRIDENRELLELLQHRASRFLELHPWVVGWLKSQDDFLLALDQALPERPKRRRGPRPWPSTALRPGQAAGPAPTYQRFVVTSAAELGTRTDGRHHSI